MSPIRQSKPAQHFKTSRRAVKQATSPTSDEVHPLAGSPAHIAQLQRQYGNRAVQGLIQRAADDDLADSEPSSAAGRMGQRHPGQAQTSLPAATSAAQVQRAAAPDAADLPAQAFGPQAADGFEAGAAFEAQLSAGRGGGTPLPDSTREFMEQRLGADFSGVKVHTDGSSHQLNQAIQAKAFTTGQDVFFRQGAYNPASRSGQALLAHELTHVVQQKRGTVQRKFTFVPDGSGEFEKEEQESFSHLLAHNNIDPLLFTAADFAALQTAYARLAPIVEKVGKSTAQKKRVVKATLTEAYTRLGVDIQSKMLAEGKPAWNAAVELVVQQYNALPKEKQVPTEKHFREISEPVWPTVGGRGAMPESFWKSVKKNIRTAYGAAAGGAGAFSTETDTVYTDMGKQFAAWDGTLTTRGAWWGSAAPGDRTGAKDVPSTAIIELQRKVAGSGWRFSNSFSGGLSFHKTRGAVDFIYHMQAASI